MKPYVTANTLATATQQWLNKIAPFNRHRMPLNKDKAILLIVDMQQFFLNPDSPTFTCGGPAILPTVKLLQAAFRKAGRPIIYTRHVHHPDLSDAGIMQWWWEGMCLEGVRRAKFRLKLPHCR